MNLCPRGISKWAGPCSDSQRWSKRIFSSHFASLGFTVCIAPCLICSRTAKHIIIRHSPATRATSFLLPKLEPLLVQRDKVEPIRISALPQLLGEWFELIVRLGLFTGENS